LPWTVVVQGGVYAEQCPHLIAPAHRDRERRGVNRCKRHCHVYICTFPGKRNGKLSNLETKDITYSVGPLDSMCVKKCNALDDPATACIS